MDKKGRYDDLFEKGLTDAEIAKSTGKSRQAINQSRIAWKKRVERKKPLQQKAKIVENLPVLEPVIDQGLLSEEALNILEIQIDKEDLLLELESARAKREILEEQKNIRDEEHGRMLTGRSMIIKNLGV